MKVVFFGTSAFGLPSLSALASSKHSLVRIVTAPDKPQGRGLRVSPSPVKQWAVSREYPVTELSRSGLGDFSREILGADADVFIVISFGILLPQTLLDIPKIAPLNLHASLLPRYRGPAPIQWALANGEKETGVSVIRMVSKLDAGDIVLQKRVTIQDSDDSQALHERLAKVGADAVLKSLEALEKKGRWTAQDENAVIYAPKIKKEDGRVRWDSDAAAVANRLRAFAGWPGSYFFMNGKRVVLLEAKAEKGPAGRPPGSVVEASERSGLVVAAGNGCLRILSLQAEGRKALPVSDFLKGFHLKPGDVLE